MPVLRATTDPYLMNADEDQLRKCADDLADAIDSAVPEWSVRSVERLVVAWSGEADADLLSDARTEGERTRDELMPRLRALLATDVDEQRSNPLSIVREAVVAPTVVLRRFGVPPVVRDETAERQFPDDDYDLVPASFGELGAEVHERGLTWGAAKAYVVLHRRRSEGQR